MNYFKRVMSLGVVFGLMSSESEVELQVKYSNGNNNHLMRVITEPYLQSEIGFFLDNVLLQMPAKDVFEWLNAQTSYTDSFTGDGQWYAYLLDNKTKLTPYFSTLKRFASLTHQKKILSDQIKELLVNVSTIDGIVEIGGPGMYVQALKNVKNITGQVYSIDELSSVMDYIKAGSLSFSKKFLTYDTFIPLNNYDSIAVESIADCSVDVIICAIGLHHIPVEKIDAFIASLYRILRPGGMFILRDHDVITPDLMDLTHAAHSLYNVLMMGESCETENNEFRNFQTLSYWIELLERTGFIIGTERLVQPGDPTKNTLFASVKKIETVQEYENVIVKECASLPNYKCNPLSSYLKTTEWYNVDVAQDYGQFINHTPFYKYPWFSTAHLYWDLFKKQWTVSVEKRGYWDTMTSFDDQSMNLFIGVSMTVEHYVKGAMSWCVDKAMSGTAPEKIMVLMTDPLQEIESVDGAIKVVKRYDNGLILIEAPRYKEFLRFVHACKRGSLTFVEIGGNKEIQIKVRSLIPIVHWDALTKGVVELYSWQMPTQLEWTYYTLDVSVNEMLSVVKTLERYGIEILYVHDF